jgi:type I restriction enzyme, S subunit
LKSKTIQEFKDTEIGKIPSDWEVTRLKDISTLYVPMRNKPKEFDGDIPWLRIEDLNGKYVSDSKKRRYVTHDVVDKMHLRILPIGTVLCSCTATIGLCAITKKEVVTNQQFVGIHTSDIDNQFLYYYLLTQTRNLINNAYGTIGGYITRKRLEDFQIILPPISEQKLIVKILSDLDSIIETLQKQSKILEQIIQAIFKSMFIDFKGVDEFTDSKLGKIPKDWTVKTLGNVLDLTKGVSYKSQDLKLSDKALVTLKSFIRGGGYTEKGLKSFDGLYKNSQVVKENDIVIAQTDLTQNADVIGKPAIIRKSKMFKTLIASLDLIVVKTKNNDIPNSFLYNLFMTNKFQNHVYGYSSGTTVLHLAKDAIPNFEFMFPAKTNLENFDNLVSFMIQKNHENNYKINNLSETFDVLLPKLMSGEIRV